MNEFCIELDFALELIKLNKEKSKVAVIQHFRKSLAPFQYVSLKDSKVVVDKITGQDWTFKTRKGNNGHHYLRVELDG